MVESCLRTRPVLRSASHGVSQSTRPLIELKTRGCHQATHTVHIRTTAVGHIWNLAFLGPVVQGRIGRPRVGLPAMLIVNEDIAARLHLDNCK